MHIISASSMHHVAGMVAGWSSMHEWLIFQFVSRNVSFQLEDDLQHEVWDPLESVFLESETANHNTWNDLLNLVTHHDFSNRVQANPR